MKDRFSWFETRLGELDAELAGLLAMAPLVLMKGSNVQPPRPAIEIWREYDTVCAEYLAAFEALHVIGAGELHGVQPTAYPERLRRYLDSWPRDETQPPLGGDGRSRFPYESLAKRWLWPRS